MKRRSFLKTAALVPMVAYFPTFARATSAPEQTLILIQLGGGNDALNTYVPYTDPAYYEARGELAVSPEETLPLTNSVGLNPVMASLMPAWESADIALVQGLGYPTPNRSHFRGIDIWHTASDADTVLTEGWLTGVLPESDSPLQGVIFDGSPGAFRGEPNQFSISGEVSNLSSVYAPQGTAATSEVQHIINQRMAYNSAVEELQAAFATDISLVTEFSSDPFSSQCKTLAEMLIAGATPQVVHLSLGSFDTHSNQRGAHDNLLQQLANGLSALRAELIHHNKWQYVTAATYCEFGRRVATNGSAGTDHGTAATHMVMGGAVSGGIYGSMPSLTDLDDGDLKFTTDFRDYYRTLSDWMLWQASGELSSYQNLAFV